MTLGVIEKANNEKLTGTDNEFPEIRCSRTRIGRSTSSEAPIAYSSVSWKEARFGGVDAGDLKASLIRSMLDELFSWSRSEETYGPAPKVDGLENFALATDSLGRPVLSLNGSPGPTVSFTTVFSGRNPLRTWAALSAPWVMLGVDAALEDEFSGDYPFHKVFHEREWEHGLLRCQEKELRTAAILWSVKEATVKALGIGWRYIEPLDLEVEEMPCAHGSKLSCDLWFKVRRRDGAMLGGDGPGPSSAIARAVRDHEGWLSIAVIQMVRRAPDSA